MTGTGKEHLVTNIASHVKASVKPEVMPRVIEYRASVHPDLGTQAATQLTGS
jgi:catalase